MTSDHMWERLDTLEQLTETGEDVVTVIGGDEQKAGRMIASEYPERYDAVEREAHISVPGPGDGEPTDGLDTGDKREL